VICRSSIPDPLGVTGGSATSPTGRT
jgi:hypothetical protein